ncbi:MAG: hypothetical protein FRX49_09692 [Trebouxia sp. A1-2]|nr:MAG: hypothetical protein FRX49_09692 [Trebouxia sp. A1-2]
MVDYSHNSCNDCIPATPEAELYAVGGHTGPAQRAPRNRTAFTPEGIRAARDARANRGNTAASGSGAGPTSAPAPRTGPPAPTGSQPAHKTHAPQPGTCYRRHARAVDMMAHLENTPMKISLGTFVKEAPECRADLIKHLQAFNRSSTSIADSRSPATKRAAEPTDDPHPTVRPFAPHRAPPVDTGPTPMETALESEACYHADQSTHVNAVVKAEVDILGKLFEGIVDTGGPVLGAGADVGPAPLPLAAVLPRLARASLAALMPSGVNAVLFLGAL